MGKTHELFPFYCSAYKPFAAQASPDVQKPFIWTRRLPPGEKPDQGIAPPPSSPFEGLLIFPRNGK